MTDMSPEAIQRRIEEVARLRKRRMQRRVVDMSPLAIERRIRRAASLVRMNAALVAAGKAAGLWTPPAGRGDEPSEEPES